LSDAAAWQQIVIEGALKDSGMVSFKQYVTPQEAENVRGYVSSEAGRFWKYQDRAKKP
jgi:hypothetical protein